MDNMKDHCQQAREYLMEDDSRHLMPLEVRLEVYRAMDSEPRLIRRTPFYMLVLREQESDEKPDTSAQDRSTSSNGTQSSERQFIRFMLTETFRLLFNQPPILTLFPVALQNESIVFHGALHSTNTARTSSGHFQIIGKG